MDSYLYTKEGKDAIWSENCQAPHVQLKPHYIYDTAEVDAKDLSFKTQFREIGVQIKTREKNTKKLTIKN